MGRYELFETVGRGGMGEVYRAYDPHLRRQVAVKLVGADLARQTPRLLREAQAMARLSHPSVVHVYDAGVAGGQVFIAMELLEGGNLSEWLGTATRTADEVLDKFMAAGRGLAAAHAAGMVHRDFKPSNVLLDRGGRVLVGDFGLAQPLPSDASDLESGHGAPVTSGRGIPTITLTGAGKGTPRYMAPEQRASAHVDARADQYSFCVALVEALEGIGPSPDVLAVAARGMAAVAHARYPTMDDLLDALEAARRPRTARRPRRGLGVVAAVAGAASIAWVVSVQGAPPETAPITPETRSALAPAQPVTAKLAAPAPRRPAPPPAAPPAPPSPSSEEPDGALEAAPESSSKTTVARPRSSRRSSVRRARRAKTARPIPNASERAVPSSSSRGQTPPEDPDGVIRDLWSRR